jgi:hypothetical protein
MTKFFRKTSTRVGIACTYIALGFIIAVVHYKDPNMLGAIGIIFTAIGIGLMRLIEALRD